MDLITVDIESHYDREYSLSKLTTEEYVRDDRFEVIGVAVKVNNGETEWASGTHTQIQRWLRHFDWENSRMLAQNTIFDGFIMSERFGIHAKCYADTMCMARAIHGPHRKASLAELAKRYRVGEKGDEVINAMGKRRADFSEAELAKYGDYCINDVDLTYAIFNKMIRYGFPRGEIQLIDLTLKMFIRPKLELNITQLEAHLADIQRKKEKVLRESGVTKEDLASSNKFAELLRQYGVEPPVKISKLTGKEVYALAKNDDGFKALAEHPMIEIQALCAGRLSEKSTLEEKRTERFLGIAKRGLMPVPLKYYAAHTGRWGGSDKVNLQNLPSRGADAGKLKDALEAPEGYQIIDSDSSQIEARVLAWLAGQDDLVEAFAEGKDVYKIMASAIYNKPEDEVTSAERFVGKTTILGAGYGMGAVRFREQLKSFGVDITAEESQDIIRVYRETYPQIVELWAEAQAMLKAVVMDEPAILGRAGVLEVVPHRNGMKLPNGLFLRYEQLKIEEEDGKKRYKYKAHGWKDIYGGKVIENVCQAIARCIIGEQMIKISKRYDVVLTVHDAIACIVPENEVEEAQAFVEECMKWTPDWAKGLPVNCESGYGVSYGDC